VSPNTAHQDRRLDELLVVRCQLGERPAFDALIKRWHGALWRYLRHLADSDDAASDLAQDTWIRVFRSLVKLREPHKFRAWLFGIARRAAMDRLRVRYSQPLRIDLPLEEIAGDEPDVNLEEEFATLEAGVASLPIVERETLSLFYLREFSIDEIGELMDVPVGTVKSRLFRARRLLRQTLEFKGEDR
jgi:RNA polymerase sigma factor (sigma-70 family)